MLLFSLFTKLGGNNLYIERNFAGVRGLLEPSTKDGREFLQGRAPMSTDICDLSSALYHEAAETGGESGEGACSRGESEGETEIEGDQQTRVLHA